jgi:hypothetical protein
MPNKSRVHSLESKIGRAPLDERERFMDEYRRKQCEADEVVRLMNSDGVAPVRQMELYGELRAILASVSLLDRLRYEKYQEQVWSHNSLKWQHVDKPEVMLMTASSLAHA